MNTSKQKSSMAKHKSQIVVISSLNNSNKKNLPISSLTLIPDKSVLDIAIIDTNSCCATYKFKKIKVCAIFMRDFQF